MIINMVKIYTHHSSRNNDELSSIVQHSQLAGLKSGLEKLGIDYEYQPKEAISAGDCVLVMSDHLMLRELIKTKREGLDFTLLAGPIFEIQDTHRAGVEQLMNVDGMPNPFLIMSRLDSIFLDVEVDGVLTAGDWAKNGWEFVVPKLGGKIHNWFAGVDVDYWDGVTSPKKKRVLVYAKTNPGIVNQAAEALKQLGMDVHIIQYGHYKKEEYREQLRLCDFSVFISEKETQGIALAEAWAMNVPTLCWDSFSSNMEGMVLMPTSSCPYLTRQTGARWRSVDDLRQLIYLYDKSYFSPRDWVVSHMSDKVSAASLLETFALVSGKTTKENLPSINSNALEDLVFPDFYLDDDPLESFLTWFKDHSPKFGLIPLLNAVHKIEDVTSVTWLRHEQFQVQLFIVPPDYVIPEHTHPNVDSFEFYLGGQSKFSLFGEWIIDENEIKIPSDFGLSRVREHSIRVLPNSPHGGVFGPSGGVFMSVQHWLNGVKPHCVSSDYTGKVMGQHHMSMVKFGDAISTDQATLSFTDAASNSLVGGYWNDVELENLGDIKGFFDRVQNGRVIGWAIASNLLSKPLPVSIFYAGEKVSSGLSDLVRKDIQKLYPKSNGIAGYNIELPNREDIKWELLEVHIGEKQLPKSDHLRKLLQSKQ
jgi:hypothetical protein